MTNRAAIRVMSMLTLLLLPLGAVLADGDAEAITIRGEILDLACYIAHDGQGEEHAKCAQSCVKGGQPMGLLASDGTVYLLFASHGDGSAFEEAKSHAGKQVELQGKPADRSGMKAIEVGSVKAL